MEPQSAFYSSPLVVLDFQSLYPSGMITILVFNRVFTVSLVMIAYNYCYSTCLGRIKDFQGKNKLGVLDLDRPAGLLEAFQNHLTGMANAFTISTISTRPQLHQMALYM
jgi:DNA polymerase zeta